MPNLITDRELLVDCAAAFEAMPRADESRKLLKKWDQEPLPYSGNRSHVLARYMAELIRSHLAEVDHNI